MASVKGVVFKESFSLKSVNPKRTEKQKKIRVMKAWS